MTVPEIHDLDIGLLRLFLQVVDNGGFTGAASRANLSLSAISSRIAALEQRLGIRLCQRGRGGFALTSDGRRVQAAALRLFAAMGEFRASVTAENQLTGEVRITVGDGFIWLPECWFLLRTDPVFSSRIDPSCDTSRRLRAWVKRVFWSSWSSLRPSCS